MHALDHTIIPVRILIPTFIPILPTRSTDYNFNSDFYIQTISFIEKPNIRYGRNKHTCPRATPKPFFKQ